MAVIIIIGSLVLVLSPPVILFFSLVRVHRPDLSNLDIVKEAAREVGETMQEAYQLWLTDKTGSGKENDK